jgi:hypothetical protein
MWKHSLTVAGQRAITIWSPCLPHRSCMMSPCAGFVASPVLGPARSTSTTTQGTSPMTASPRFSCIREKPGPLVAVNALAPAREAPMTAAMLAISSSICRQTPPTFSMTLEHSSAISEDGVMGYPA